jgi:BirA family biotin operon repressor/biotin-[acetyl-CoA-carboxylase] ligase
MLTEHTVAAAARAAGIVAPIHFAEVTGSTNSDAMALAAQGAPEWTVVVAAKQEAGRGRLGRTWVAPSGTSLHVSVILRPSADPADGPVFSLVAAVAAAEACGVACGVDVRCKWPNDLLVGNRKLGGILAEASVEGTRLRAVAVGTGINVHQREEDFPAGLRAPATSIAIEGGRADIPGLLQAYLGALRRLCEEGAPGLAERVAGPYRERCETLGRTVEVSTGSGAQVRGRAVDLGPRGELVVETASGRRTVTSGEVVHLDPAS